MWIVFEDAEDSELAPIIKIAYASTGVNVGFAGGSGNIPAYIESHCKRDKVLVYHDVIPDNANTAKNYRTVKTRLRHRENTIIVPVICTEYYVLKSFGNPPSLRDVVLNTVYPEGVSSAEKYYKYLLGVEVADCQKTGKFAPKDKTLISGIYYRSDCLCQFSDDSCKSLSLLSKSISFNRCLPIVAGIPILKPFSSKSYTEIIQSFTDRHNAIVNTLADEFAWSEPKRIKALI